MRKSVFKSQDLSYFFRVKQHSQFKVSENDDDHDDDYDDYYFNILLLCQQER